MNNLTARIILLNSKKEILVLKDKDSNYWGLPGGGIKLSESPQKGLAREIKEEISIKLLFNLKLVGVEYRQDKKNSEVIFVFYGGILSNRNIAKIKPDNEISKAKFINTARAYRLLTPSMTRRLRLIIPNITKGMVYLENGQKV